MMSFEPEFEEIPEIEDLSNGLLLSNYFIPEEILVNLLVFVGWKDLMSCRLVCHSWKRLVDSVVSYEKLKRNSTKALSLSFTLPVSDIKTNSVPFYLYFTISQGAFGKNHLKNPWGSGDISHVCQSDRRRMCSDENCPRFKYWNVTHSGGSGWTVETVPVGSQPLPEHLEGRSCFVTSYNWSRKDQLVTLEDCGLSAKIMDDVQPYLQVSEWYAKRFDCGIQYKLNVTLLNSNQEVVDEFNKEITDTEGNNDWHQISHIFKDYGRGVRYLRFQHSGKDTQFWAGHYGAKIAGGSVVAQIPGLLYKRSCDSV